MPTEHLTGQGDVFKKLKNKEQKLLEKFQNFRISSKVPSKIDHNNPFFLLFKLALSFNWALKWTRTLIKNFFQRRGTYFDWAFD